MAPAALAQDAERGQALYDRTCIAFHSPDADRTGPRHRGVVGRVAGSVPGFDYTDALQTLGLTWTPANIDRFIAGLDAVAPGTAMTYSMQAAGDRADVIAYLGTLRGDPPR